ncbi:MULTISPECIES: GNAT family N-acetyltransferase [Actinokineospora]|uniref:Ribosomal-protein-alanine N-acetyltransferase n=1 Tax=Actinokineospora fastidiosa TaxID=1816 RepID=A0A918G1V3_9PSEU|nr:MULTISPECIES: GNAT family protein [Actinokineospora]UVS76921.1 ribosomal-protein-S5-alanine N-acetyltransferase [Actinokineospora sp. UTMC 2448]GGS14862.1 ribosomal-protein-alanine N-acetyltransferase [Actinokineospora fastidiosa]
MRLGPLRVPAGVVELRPPRLSDGGTWSRVRLRDRRYLEEWEPVAPGTWEDRNSPLAWLAQWGTLRGLARRGVSIPLVIVLDGRPAGQITVGGIVRGALCSGWVGYWVGTHAAGGGVATAAVAMVVDHCFASAGLHRVEATVRPENVPSLRVLAKLGFREEGLFRRYLDVAGDWRDHRCLALTTEDIPGGLVARLLAEGRAAPAEKV